MSRPVLLSATRRLPLVPHCPRSFSTSRTVLNCFSASSDPSTSRQPAINTPPLHTSRRTRPSRYSAYRASVSPFAGSRQHAAFSSSTVRPSAKIIQNEKKDEEGKVLMVGISSRAAERLREISDPTSSPSPTKEDNPYHHLRITVTSGGCHGFQYMMSLEAASKLDAEEDTVFEAEQENPATQSEGGEALVAMDEPSLELLSGSTVDYTTELIGSQFQIVDNPRASSNCGCGTSFDVDV